MLEARVVDRDSHRLARLEHARRGTAAEHLNRVTETIRQGGCQEPVGETGRVERQQRILRAGEGQERCRHRRVACVGIVHVDRAQRMPAQETGHDDIGLEVGSSTLVDGQGVAQSGGLDSWLGNLDRVNPGRHGLSCERRRDLCRQVNRGRSRRVNRAIRAHQINAGRLVKARAGQGQCRIDARTGATGSRASQEDIARGHQNGVRTGLRDGGRVEQGVPAPRCRRGNKNLLIRCGPISKSETGNPSGSAVHQT